MPAIDLTGQRFGRLIALNATEKRKRRSVVWRFECDCGSEVELAAGPVRAGVVSSCGCLRKEVGREKIERIAGLGAKATRTHGHSKGRCGRPTPTFTTWVNMIQRCTNPKHKNYGRYGGRGITVCERWLNSFETFLKDMGEKPAGVQIDRKDNNLGYEPGNCRWATPRQNINNREVTRRITLLGRTQTLEEWATELNVSHQAIAYRLNNGWSVEEALSMPFDYANGWNRGVR